MGKYCRLIVGLFLLLPALLSAANSSFESSSKQIALLELYTSEGCSSCPPADRWLSSLREKNGLWRDFIPIALHVDYWDYIGWKDRFASPEYSARQRQYAREQSLKTVYTPGFVYNGREWRHWFSKRFPSPKGKTPGVLKIQMNEEYASVQFIPTHFTREKLKVNLALLGFGLETDIKAGENSGKKLPHNFVVLALDHTDLESGNEFYRARLPIPGSSIKSKRYGIVAWINSAKNQTPIQAVGGWLP